ncbi:DUF6364 family protein [Mucilaginibacter sp. RS28]|uniref:DUF6364 family protein n=1 Tax=Mucilaginibacter straminoryzae TaxID=2932774 RepID=A0A9X1X568_9SPHI|nr:DUF6364 family protein [Mucilaginibacter straminoryzae]MCJ8211272.1 DUF6364 family protein [Mucilaginibacter straminoryzae]
MATTKLTLSIEADTIEKAKKYAKKQHTSLSKLFTNFVNEVAGESKNEDDPLLKKIKETEPSEVVRALTGIIKMPDNFDVKEAKYQYLKEKYGL